MCGHVGVAGDLTYKDEGLIRKLLLLDFFRGPDSTGLAAIRGDGTAHIAKLASHPLDLFDMARFKTALSGHNSKIFLGHNRAATKGAVNAVNAHPYECGHIIGAHNGTLSPGSWTALKEKLGEDHGTDSHSIFACIERFGIQETMSLLVGAWSLVWFNREDNTLNFLRNKERPMWYAYTSNFDRIIWSSEWAFIDAAMKMSNTTASSYELFAEEGTGYKYWSTEADIYYKFDMAEFKSKAKDKGRPKPVAKELKGKDVAVSCGDPFGRTGQQNGYGRWANGKFIPADKVVPALTGPTTPLTTISRGIKRPSETNVISMYGTSANPLAGVLTKAQFDKIAQYGCSWCQADVEYTEVGVTVFERDDIVLCPGCSDNGKGKEPASRVYLPNIQQLL